MICPRCECPGGYAPVQAFRCLNKACYSFCKWERRRFDWAAGQRKREFNGELVSCIEDFLGED